MSHTTTLTLQTACIIYNEFIHMTYLITGEIKRKKNETEKKKGIKT